MLRDGTQIWTTPQVRELPVHEATEIRSKFGATIFGLHAPRLLVGGYSPVPIEPGAKRPLAAIGDWSRLRTTPLTTEEIDAIAERWPNAGIGVVGGFGGNTPIDIDTDDP